MARETVYRGKMACVFGDGGEQPGDFCEWNATLIKRLSDKADYFDRIELCRLCQEQSTLRALSFVGSMLKADRKQAP
jgi:hypothetical protein